MANKKEKTIEEKYQHLDEISHILKRPGMYIGSVKREPKLFFLYNSEIEQFEMRDIEYVPALLKLCDEVISNSCDEFRRPTNMGLTEMTVTIDNNGSFKVRDNGGIPVVKHKTANMMLPDFLFSQLRTSSNYDDSESRDVVGTNGVGQTICGIYSNLFKLSVSDSKNWYTRSWTNNMRQANESQMKRCKEHFTETYYEFDLDRFEDVSELSDDFIDVIEKRCIDAAAANLGLTVKFIHNCNGEFIRESMWKFNTFDEYINLYSNYVDCGTCIHTSDKQKDIWFFPDGNLNIGFVNGAECSSGTHIRAIHNSINEVVAAHITSKKKLEIQPKHVDGKYSVFCTLHVDNPTYDSQTKDTLTTPVNKFDTTVENYQFSVSKKFLDEVCKTDIIDTVVDWYKQKLEVEDQKMLRKLNKDAKKKLKYSDKFIDCSCKNRAERELWIFEGLSASCGGRCARTQNQAMYLLRGVILNVIDATPSKIMANKELGELINIIGLQWGKKNLKEDLNFNKIVIATDADADGTKIAALLLLMFNIFPELFEYQMIMRVIPPLIIATKGDKSVDFYSFKEYEERKEEVKGFHLKYSKGIGSLNDQQYKKLMREGRFHVYKKDDLTDATLHRWFGKGIAKERHDVLKTEV